MIWFECKRTKAGEPVFSGDFKYCRAHDGKVLFSNGTFSWFVSSVEGAKKFFVRGVKVDDAVGNTIEECYQRSVKYGGK